MRISDHRVEKLATLKEIQRPSNLAGSWVGLAPDDSPLFLRDLSVQEIYARDWEAP